MQMEITATSLGTAIAVVAILTWAWRVLNWVWLKPTKLERCLRQQGFAGNSYRLWYGDLKENTKMLIEAASNPMSFSNDIAPRVLPLIHQSVKNYGKNSFTWIGPTPRVTIMDPELLKNILSKTSNFQKQKSNPLVELLATGIASYEDEKWATHRRIINPAFHLEKLKHMLPAFYLSSSEMLKNWEKLVSTDGSCELDVCPYLQNMTSDVISRTAFGSSYMEGSRIFQLLKEQVGLVLQAVQSTYIPGWRFLPTTNNKRMKEIDKEIRVSLTGIIKKRENAIKAGEAANDDLLGLLMESNVKEINEHGNNKNMGMSTRDVIEECKLFYFAGQETTSALLIWTMILLSKHQDWQTLAREEVLQAFGNDTPNFDGLNHLKIVTMIFYEVLRLYPPLVTVDRAVYKETKLGKFVLPAGVAVSLPMILIQQDPELWGEDALEFKPERFSEGVSKATKNQISFFPFGWGPRICIGQNFAMIEAKMALAMILQRFLFELSPSYAHAPLTVLLLQPQYGAHIILHKL